jgi:Reverse transcriptase (RNA-dependent DNA polymerase)
VVSLDNMSHEWTMKFVEHRVADSRILRLIQKWLQAGVSEDGQWSETKVGTPQGAVASPLLANVYLHYVFDLWVEAWRKKVAKGDVIVVRYADDLVVGFENRAEAERFLAEFRERLAKFGRHAVLGSAKTAFCALDSSAPCSASIPDRTFRRHSSEVGAVCIKVARTVLCGGRPAMAVPTAPNCSPTSRPGRETLVIGCHLAVLRGEVNARVLVLPYLSGFLVVRDRSEFQELNRRAVVNDHRHCHTWRGTVRFNHDFLTFEGLGKVIDLKSNMR